MALGDEGSCCRRLSACAGASLRAIAPFPPPAHRTGHADFPHPALGQGITLSRATPSAAFESFPEVVGLHHSPDPRSPDVDPELRLLSSAGITRLLRYYEPLRHPPRPGLPLTRFRVGVQLPAARASRVPNDFLLHTCRRHYPGGIPQTNVAHLIWRTAAFPESQAGRLPHRAFRGLLNVHSRSGLHARQVARGDPLHRRLRRIRYLLRRSDCYRLERPVAGWDSLPLRIADFHGVLRRSG